MRRAPLADVGAEGSPTGGAPPPADGADELPARRRLLARLAPPALFALVFLAHWALVAGNAVDVPFWDEWEMLRAEAPPLDGPLDGRFLFYWHNEHRHTLTRLQVWLHYRLDGWNVARVITANFAIWGAVCLLTAQWLRRLRPAWSPWAVWGAAALLLSPIAWENHVWGLQSHFHSLTAAAIGCCWALFAPSRHPGAARLALGVACGWLALLSNAAGVLVCGVTALCFAAEHVRRAVTDRSRRDWALAVVVPGLLLGAVALWASDSRSVAGQGEHALPWELRFWEGVAELAALGFGYRSTSSALSVFGGLLVAGPLLCWLWRSRGRLSGPTAPAAVGALVLLGVLGSIAFGRAHLSSTACKASRYASLAGLLVLLSWVLADAALSSSRRAQVRGRARSTALALSALFAALGHADELVAAPERYAAQRRRRVAGLAALDDALRSGAPLRSDELFPAPLEQRLRRAYDLELSFTRRLPRPEHP